MERRSAFAAAWVATLASTPVTAQAPPTFPARTELVIVDVTVLDRDGRPQAGLGARDFRVTEDGRPQEIVSFEAVSAAEAGEAAASPSGAHQAEAAAGARFVLVFDDLHLEPIQTVPAGQAIRAFLERHVRAGDTLTLLAPGHGLSLVSRAGESRGPVVRALARLQGLKVVDPCQALSEFEAMRIVVYGDEPMVPSVRRPSAFRERSPCPPSGTMDAHSIHADAQRRDTGLLEALRAALATTGETPERTSVVLLSGGFVDDPTLADRAQAVVRSSLRARASYTSWTCAAWPASSRRRRPAARSPSERKPPAPSGWRRTPAASQSATATTSRPGSAGSQRGRAPTTSSATLLPRPESPAGSGGSGSR